MPITSDEFRAALSKFASGVTVVTTRDAQGRLHGITVTAFASVSLEPPLVLVCIDNATASHYAFHESGMFVVNILKSDQASVSQQFATPFMDKFDGVEFELSDSGVPILAGTLASLVCRITNAVRNGDHTVFFGEIEKAIINSGEPLAYFDGSYQHLSEFRKTD
ncbi:MAG TPA: flavin reductase family protein [Pyrinomonadaceae bacterium]|nr:flavin reductase family protein [Chloracidobacterium sp.]MBP9934887.1 flavin reductase family protein [Pyrinomonadaceae bacterium]MBK7803312.1 flavin reductase family protein [Chloracidobacterium sp.]MBK9438565.1 flavin reductase family protein [Chloracidobacterium sp.]MBK9766607.1 flavin reductase family protein [Chloracidobacterium sp.]